MKAARVLPRVLLVDDEKDSVRGIERALRDLAKITVAATFDDGRALLEGGLPLDALIVDLHLDRGTGLDLLAFARDHGYPTTPAILVTGGLRNEYVNPVHALRAEILTKPFPSEQLRAFLQRAVEAATSAASQSSAFPPDPVTSVMTRGRLSLTDCVDDLRRLFSVRQTWDARYAIGTIVNQMRTTLGPRAVPAAAAGIGQNRVKLYRCAKVAARWTAAEVAKLLELEMRNGKRLSWRHLVVLASVEANEERDALLAKTLAESLTAPVLEQLAGDPQPDEG